MSGLETLMGRVWDLESALRAVHDYHCVCKDPGGPNCTATPVGAYALLRHVYKQSNAESLGEVDERSPAWPGAGADERDFSPETP